jgi:hypothetical protein
MALLSASSPGNVPGFSLLVANDELLDVRFVPKADMPNALVNVRLRPKADIRHGAKGGICLGLSRAVNPP